MEKTLNRKDILVRNTNIGAIKIIIQYILQFVIRTIFMRTLGMEYLGLNGLFSNIIGCLSIVELGIGSAIVFSMYKPIAEGDYDKLSALYRLYRNFYYVIAFIILAAGVIIMPFLKHLITGSVPSDVNLYIIYGVVLFNTVIGYFWAHKRSLLFANQRNDVESKISILFLIVLNLIQILVLVFLRNYYAYIICSPIVSIIENIVISVECKKLFPKIKTKTDYKLDTETKSAIKKNIVATGMLQVGGALITSTDNILISAMLGLAILGAYSNYATIILGVTTFITLITNTTRSTAGNLIATEPTEYVYKQYNILNFMICWISSFCAVCLLCLLNPFILIWTKDYNYLLSMPVVVVLVANFYLACSISLTGTFKVSAGLMWYDRWKTIIQGIINIVASVLLTHFFGLIGIFLGTLICYVVPLWTEPYILFKHYFKTSQKSYWIKFVLFAVVTAVSGGLTYFICSLLPMYGITWLIVRAIICLIVPNIVLFLCYFKTNEFKQGLSIIKKQLNKLFKFKDHIYSPYEDKENKE